MDQLLIWVWKVTEVDWMDLLLIVVAYSVGFDVRWLDIALVHI
jgi:hypothetical protein